MSGWTQEFENALAWFAAAPGKVKGSINEALAEAEAKLDAASQAVKDTCAGAAEWVWVTLQGDFAEDQSTAQIVTGTVISMIPFVDQICDVRDIVANCKKIHETKEEDESSFWNWVAIALTLIGLFPTLGSFFKGCFKVLFRYVRKGIAKSGGGKAVSAIWKAVSPWLEQGIAKLNQFLARPEVRKYISQQKIDNVYKTFAERIRKVAKEVNVTSLLKQFDGIIDKLKGILDFVKKWGGAAMQTKAGRLLGVIDDVRKRANAQIGKALQPAQDVLDRVAKRLDLEHQMQYRAVTNVMNPAAFKRVNLDAEVEAFRKNVPDWADARKSAKYQGLQKSPPIPEGYLDLNVYDDIGNFHTLSADVIPEGTVLVRVIDPGSNPKGVYWMTEAEFKKLHSKSDWRRKFAVWGNWNGNGEYVTYTVPPGGLPAWRGQAASQQLTDRSGKAVLTEDGKGIFTEGGAEQLAINPAAFDDKYLSKRQPTNWGYDVSGEESALVGVPALRKKP